LEWVLLLAVVLEELSTICSCFGLFFFLFFFFFFLFFFASELVVAFAAIQKDKII
jgi:hypothetical protein